MELCQFTELSRLEADRFGIPTPDGPAFDGPVDVMFVPGLAFGLDGSRLGYGAGFYDRFLAERPRPRVLCGLGFGVQVVERAPAQPHDIRLTHIATPERIVVCARRAR
jgi:5-formyltetrahydrofolate cyclo-ligase